MSDLMSTKRRCSGKRINLNQQRKRALHLPIVMHREELPGCPLFPTPDSYRGVDPLLGELSLRLQRLVVASLRYAPNKSLEPNGTACIASYRLQQARAIGSARRYTISQGLEKLFNSNAHSPDRGFSYLHVRVSGDPIHNVYLFHLCHLVSVSISDEFPVSLN